jgi:hypothetical protein
LAIKLVFSVNREMMRFIVINKVILYSDRRWGNFIKCVPKPENFLNKIKMSRNNIPAFLGTMFTLSDEDLEEYKNAKNDNELAEIIIKDSRLKGAQLILRTDVDDEQVRDIKFID